MNFEELRENLTNLSWDKPIKIQEDAMEKLKEIDELKMIALIRPLSKSCWENAAKVLIKIGYPKNRSSIPGLIEWMRDMNWPGVDVIWEYLKTIDAIVLVQFIEVAIVKAVGKDDISWIAGIKRLIEELGIDESLFSCKEVYEFITNS